MFSNKLRQARKLGTSDGGFTLIELLIVIVILGVLAGIVVFSVRGIQDRGNVAACKTEVSTVQTAVEAYYATNNAYPTTATEWASLSSGSDALLHSVPSYVTGVDTAGLLSMASGAPCTAS